MSIDDAVFTPNLEYFIGFIPMKYSTCNNGEHRFWAHGGRFDACICGEAERHCKGIERCKLEDMSWLPRKVVGRWVLQKDWWNGGA